MSNYIPNPQNVIPNIGTPMTGQGIPVQGIPYGQMGGGGYYGSGGVAAPSSAPAPSPVAPQTIPAPAFSGIGVNNYYPQPQQTPVMMGSNKSILTDDYRTMLFNDKQQNLSISDIKFARGHCDHKNPDGTIAAIIDTNTHMASCPICNTTFKITAADKDSCEKICDQLSTFFETAKLLNINTPQEVMCQLADAIVIIDNIFPKVFTNICNTWTNAYKTGFAKYTNNGANQYYGSNFRYANNTANALGAIQSGMALNPYAYNQYYGNVYGPQYGMPAGGVVTTMQPQYNSPFNFQQQGQPTMNNPTVQPAMNYGTASYGPNAFVNNVGAQPPMMQQPVTFNQPMMQQQTYSPYAQQPAITPSGVITPAGIASGVSAAAMQAAQNVVIPGATNPAVTPAAAAPSNPTTTATTPTAGTPDVGKLDA